MHASLKIYLYKKFKFTRLLCYLNNCELASLGLPQLAASVPVVSETFDIIISISRFEFITLFCSVIT